MRDPKEARELLNESLRYFRRAGSPRGETEVIGGLAYVTFEEGDLPAALELFSQSAGLAAEIGFTWWEVAMLAGEAECLVDLGRLDEAEDKGTRHLELARAIGDRQACVFALLLFALIAVGRGDRVRAGLLWGAIEAEEERAPLGQWALERDRYLTGVLAADDADVMRARHKGRALSLEAALEEALGGGRAAAGA